MVGSDKGVLLLFKLRRSSVFRLPSSVLRLPSFVLRLPSSVLRLPSSVFRSPSSVLRLPSSVLRLPSSVLFPAKTDIFSILHSERCVIRCPHGLARDGAIVKQDIAYNVPFAASYDEG